MRRKGMFAALVVGVAALAVAAYALAGGSGAGFNHLSATLSGYQEVPAVSTTGTATVHSGRREGRAVDQLEAELRRARRDDAAVAHPLRPAGRERRDLGVPLHESRQRADGNAGVPALRDDRRNDHGRRRVAAIPATAGARAQGINTGEFDELIRAIDAGKAYANIHSTIWPGGEIRAQLNEADRHN